MRITIKIPVTNKHFSLFAQGKVTSISKSIGKPEYFVVLDGHYPIVLYYRVLKHRKLFICTPKKLDVSYPRIIFPESSSPLTVLSELSGRDYDRYKRATHLLEEKYGPIIFTMGNYFFIRLAELCRAGKNSLANMDYLVSTSGFPSFLHTHNNQ